MFEQWNSKGEFRESEVKSRELKWRCVIQLLPFFFFLLFYMFLVSFKSVNSRITLCFLMTCSFIVAHTFVVVFDVNGWTIIPEFTLFGITWVIATPYSNIALLMGYWTVYSILIYDDLYYVLAGWKDFQHMMAEKKKFDAVEEKPKQSIMSKLTPWKKKQVQVP